MKEQDYIDIILYIEKVTGQKAAQVFRTFPHLWVSFGLACELKMPSSIASMTANITSGQGFAEPGAPTEQELQREVDSFVEKLERARDVVLQEQELIELGAPTEKEIIENAKNQ